MIFIVPEKSVETGLAIIAIIAFCCIAILVTVTVVIACVCFESSKKVSSKNYHDVEKLNHRPDIILTVIY